MSETYCYEPNRSNTGGHTFFKDMQFENSGLL